MFYRRLFSGSVANYNERRNASVAYGQSGTISIFSSQTDVLNQALEEVLSTCGYTCSYDQETGYLWIDGFPMSIYFTTGCYYRVCLPFSSNMLVNVSNTTNSPFSSSATAYQFYVTVKGDPDGVLDVYIGTYASPATTNATYSFSIGKGKDLRDQSSIFTLSTARNYGMYVYKKTEDGIALPEGLMAPVMLNFGFTLTSNVDLTQSGNKIVLVSSIAQTGIFTLDQCYFGCQAFTADCFYNIGGSIYYVRDNYTIVKCTNAILQNG